VPLAAAVRGRQRPLRPPGTGEFCRRSDPCPRFQKCGIPRCPFPSSMKNSREVGRRRLVSIPLIKAVGLRVPRWGPRRLSSTSARQRPEPIPFSVSRFQVIDFVWPRPPEPGHRKIGAGWAGSLTMGAGQFLHQPRYRGRGQGGRGRSLCRRPRKMRLEQVRHKSC